MSLSGKKIFVSLAVKNAVAYIILILLSSGFIGYFLYRYSSEVIIESSEQQLSNTLEILDIKFNSHLQNIKKDILYLSRSPYLKDQLQKMHQQTEISRNLLAEDYVSFMSTKSDYAQLRVIGKQNTGQEILRVDRSAEGLHLVHKDQLQQKGIYSYFKETVELPEDSVYFSVIDLNKEFGKISIPEISTLRAACPIYIADTVFGIVILNANLNAFFDEIKKSVPKAFKLFLINHEGHYLLHPDPALQFGFEKNQAPSAFEDLKMNPKLLNISNSEIQKNIHDNKLLSYKKVIYPRSQYYLVLGLQADREDLLTFFYRWKGSIIWITLGIIALAVFTALWWLRKQTSSLKTITLSMTSFEQNLQTEKLPVQLNDEIGLLARSFSSMAQTIKQNISTLAQARDAAEKANQQKEEFLQNMSHEIRNPLQTIIGMCRILVENNPRSDQTPLIESLKYSSEHLLALVNDVLDFRKLQEGGIQLNFESVVLDKFLDQLEKSYLYESKTRKIKFTLDVPEHIRQMRIISDPVRLNQILHNLIANAFKFTEEQGQVRLQLRLNPNETPADRIQFIVKDTGIGIDPKHMEWIKNRYTKIPRKDQKFQSNQGSGLGLPIVVQLLELFQSELHIQSSPDAGSEFSFSLSLRNHQDSKSSGPLMVSQQELMLDRILILDDDPQILYFYSHVLSGVCPRIDQLQHPKMLSLHPDYSAYNAIITDYFFESEKITDHLQILQERLQHGGQIICITGAHDTETIARENPELFLAVFQKPVRAEKLLDCLKNIRFKYIKPDFQVLQNDYDQDRVKIGHALKLLRNEWISAMQGLEQAVREKDPQKIHSVKHRLANSLRRIGLHTLESEISTLADHCDSEKSLLNVWTSVHQQMEFVWSELDLEIAKYEPV